MDGARHGTREAQATGRWLAVIAVVSAVLGWKLGAAALAFAAAASFAVLYWYRPRAAAKDDTDAPLRAHLARARRRDEGIDLLVVRLPAPAAESARELKASLRVTDSVCLSQGRGTWELKIMLDRSGLDREALLRRVEASAGSSIEAAWAQFPEEGYTLGVLLAQARSSLRPIHAQVMAEHSDAISRMTVTSRITADVQTAVSE